MSALEDRSPLREGALVRYRGRPYTVERVHEPRLGIVTYSIVEIRSDDLPWPADRVLVTRGDLEVYEHEQDEGHAREH